MISEWSKSILDHAAGGDPERWNHLLGRVESGEPAAYAAGWLPFRGRWFHCDSRAYITDPEASLLVDQVLLMGDQLQSRLTRPLRVLEFGVGAGTLAISVKLERPDWQLSGLDIDPPALALAADNADLHQVELELVESDFLAGWADREPPDLLFADPPWGNEADLYDGERDASHYHAMPVASAFPRDGRTGIHDELLRRLVSAAWPSQVVLNYGILPIAEIERSASCLPAYQIQPVRTADGSKVSVLFARPLKPQPDSR